MRAVSENKFGLYYYRARDYDPVTGRFLQEDPIWFDSGDMNVYRYTWNNPLMWRDRSGLSPSIETGGVLQTIRRNENVEV